MKKTLITLSVLAATAFGFSAQAQTQNNNLCPVGKECPDKQCVNKPRKAYDPFAGMNLTEQQRQKLSDLRTATKAKKAANDSTERVRRAEKKTQAKDMRADYLKSVKSILTPEQYVQFLENNYINVSGHKKGHGRHFGKDGRKDKKFARGDRRNKGFKNESRAMKDNNNSK